MGIGIKEQCNAKREIFLNFCGAMHHPLVNSNNSVYYEAFIYFWRYTTVSCTIEVVSRRSNDMHNGFHHKCLLPTSTHQIELSKIGVKEEEPEGADARV